MGYRHFHRSLLFDDGRNSAKARGCEKNPGITAQQSTHAKSRMRNSRTIWHIPIYLNGLPAVTFAAIIESGVLPGAAASQFPLQGRSLSSPRFQTASAVDDP